MTHDRIPSEGSGSGESDLADAELENAFDSESDMEEDGEKIAVSFNDIGVLKESLESDSIIRKSIVSQYQK